MRFNVDHLHKSKLIDLSLCDAFNTPTLKCLPHGVVQLELKQFFVGRIVPMVIELGAFKMLTHLKVFDLLFQEHHIKHLASSCHLLEGLSFQVLCDAGMSEFEKLKSLRINCFNETCPATVEKLYIGLESFGSFNLDMLYSSP